MWKKNEKRRIWSAGATTTTPNTLRSHFKDVIHIENVIYIKIFDFICLKIQKMWKDVIYIKKLWFTYFFHRHSWRHQRIFSQCYCKSINCRHWRTEMCPKTIRNSPPSRQMCPSKKLNVWKKQGIGVYIWLVIGLRT